MLLARVRAGLEGASLSGSGDHWIMTSRQALEMATRGGAAVLGRSDIGSLETGKCADFIAFDLNQLDYAGALQDPVSAIVFCSPQKVNYNVVNGNVIIREGHFLPFDTKKHAARHNQAAQRLLSGI
jgi:8-oxoguanine deaminase